MATQLFQDLIHGFSPSTPDTDIALALREFAILAGYNPLFVTRTFVSEAEDGARDFLMVFGNINETISFSSQMGYATYGLHSIKVNVT